VFSFVARRGDLNDPRAGSPGISARQPNANQMPQSANQMPQSANQLTTKRQQRRHRAFAYDWDGNGEMRIRNSEFGIRNSE